ncbi:MAG: Coenzyme F420 hydrogenase/dehydrogenase, beta subunit C-terminal domain [Acutalibacteraceae bacterium]
MISITNKSLCVGCGACADICPHKCINMTYDGEGFLYPVIDESSCIDCGLCTGVCPVINAPIQDNNIKPNAFALINKNDDERFASSSGGAFPLLAKMMINNGAIVFGAVFDDEFNVLHSSAQSVEDIKKQCSSKYVQSNTNGCYKLVNNLLKEGKEVMFVGTPCQAAGLKHYLGGTDTSNLLLVDFVCHGVPSPGVWKKYLSEKFDDIHDIKDINFRYKKHGWRDLYFNAGFISGKPDVCEPSGKNEYFMGFLKNITLRPTCYDCKFKTANRISDITLADFWGVMHVLPEMYDNKGCSLILTHTQKGLQKIKDTEPYARLVSVDFDKAAAHNTAILRSAPKHKNRDKFFDDYKAGKSVIPALRAAGKEPIYKKFGAVIRKISRRILSK